MFDVIETNYKNEGGGMSYHHNDVNDIRLFKDMGSVRRVPIEAITSQDYSDVELCESTPMPNYSALQNIATGELLDTHPLVKSELKSHFVERDLVTDSLFVSVMHQSINLVQTVPTYSSQSKINR